MKQEMPQRGDERGSRHAFINGRRTSDADAGEPRASHPLPSAATDRQFRLLHPHQHKHHPQHHARSRNETRTGCA